MCSESQVDVSNAERYLRAFGRIETRLKEILGNRQGLFRKRVEWASPQDARVELHRLDLIEYGDLRNAIVHERGDGKPIADPRTSTVERIEEIADLITTPPRIGSVAASPVVLLEPADPIDHAVRRMHAGFFSQMPVYDGDRFVGLLTSPTLVWWLAASETTFRGKSPIAEVLPFTEFPDTHVHFVAEAASVFDGIHAFERAVADGIQVDAVLVTPSGSRDERPSGILTVSDLPSAYRVAGVRR